MSSTLTVLRILVSLCPFTSPFCFLQFVDSLWQCFNSSASIVGFEICRILVQLVCFVEFSFVSHVVLVHSFHAHAHSIKSPTHTEFSCQSLVTVYSKVAKVANTSRRKKSNAISGNRKMKRKWNSIAKHKSHTWTLDVTDDATRGVVHEFNADLSDTTTGA